MSQIDELSEKVAAAKRKVKVANELTSEYRRKLNMANDEANDADRELQDATYALAQAAIDAHGEVHGREISDEDRHAFEIRWAADIAEKRAETERRRAKAATISEQPILAG